MGAADGAVQTLRVQAIDDDPGEPGGFCGTEELRKTGIGSEPWHAGVRDVSIFARIIKAVKLLTPMRNSITLFHFQDEDIKIDIVARFDGDKLVIDGFDIGKTVEEAWGDSDYEYVMTIPATSVASLYGLLDVEAGNRKKLLKALAKRFHGNKCFSAIGDLLEENNIEYDRFTWA